MKYQRILAYFQSFDTLSLPDSSGRKFLEMTFCASGIYFAYSLYGLLQEKLFSTTYYKADQSSFKFSESSVLILLQSITSFFIGRYNNRLQAKSDENNIPRGFGIKLGLFNSVAMIGSVSALNYISYPVQALMKSSKILSVMMVTLLVGGKRHSLYEYSCALLIGMGILIFNLLGNKQSNSLNEDNSSVFGIFLLVVSLFSDGMLAETQRSLKEVVPDFTTYQLMEETSKYCIIFSLVYGVCSQELLSFFQILLEGPAKEFLMIFFLIIFLGTIGQIFIFQTIRIFGPIVCGVITTTRKFFAVICSIVVFNHSINLFQWISVVFVFAGVGVEMFYSFKVKGFEENKKSKEFKV